MTASFILHPSTFNLIASAPGGVPKLRELILQLAVSGKLVPQDPKDEVAGIAQGRLVMPEAIPYEIPKQWVWTTLRSVSSELGQKVPKAPFTYIDVSAIDKEHGRIGDDIQILNPENAPSRARKIVNVGSVIYSTVRPYLLNIAVIDREFNPQPIVSTAFFVMHPHKEVMARYLFYYLRSQPFTDYVNKSMTGMAYPAINDSKMSVGPIPLPPLSEQKRIVAKVDELMKRCDELEARQKERHTRQKALTASCLNSLADPKSSLPSVALAKEGSFNLLFPSSESVAELRKTILQLAVQGRLVPQDPRDEPAEVLISLIAKRRRGAKAKEYGPVIKEEMPYEIPGSWVWVRLGNIAITSDSGWSPQCDSGSRVNGNWGVLKVSAVSWGVYKPEENKALPSGMVGRPDSEVHAGAFLLSRANTEELVARSVIVENTPPRLMMSDKIVRFVFSEEIEKAYINLANLSDSSRAYYARNASGTSSSMKNIGREVMCNLPIPFPPIAEQKRIVAKVNDLMVMCDELETKLTQSSDVAEKLAGSVVGACVEGCSQNGE